MRHEVEYYSSIHYIGIKRISVYPKIQEEVAF